MEVCVYMHLKPEPVVKFVTGIPVQMTTDCGSETTQLYGLVNALRCVLLLLESNRLLSHTTHTREIFHPEFDNRELPAHVYLRSVRNISIERSWLCLRLEFGNNAIISFDKGVDDGIYNPDIEEH